MFNLDTFITDLTQVVGTDGILKNDKKAFETDWRGRYSNPSIAVVLPNNVEQVSSILKICNQNKIGVVPQGGNTSLCGGSVPNDSGNPQIILNLRRLDKVINIDIDNQSITVEAGCGLHFVSEYAKKNGLYFPLSMASEGSCQIGGAIATNAGGIHVIKYGMMRELVLGLEVCLPDGSVVNQLHGLRKNNTYFDLKQLFIGSEGTLGIVTKATLILHQQPEDYFTAMCGVDSISKACALLKILNKSYNICAFEIINPITQEVYNKHFPPMGVSAPWVILFELELLF